MHGGHDGDPDVDQASLVADPETAVLRNAAFGNIQLTHHLDTRQNGRFVLVGDWRHGRVQYTVDAVPHVQVALVSLEVNIGGAPVKRRKDDGIYQPDDWVGALLRRQSLDGDVLIGIVIR